MPPLVSVIIPTYNRATWLMEAVASVLAQRYRPLQLIVVDDGSNDDTAQRLAPWRHRLLLLRQENRGVSAARNRGVAAAGGQLIAFLDSDDLWLPDKLACQVAFMQRQPAALICQTEERWIRNGVRVNPRQRHAKPAGMIFEASLALCLVSPSAVMLRRTLFEAMQGFDEHLPACEDYDLWLRIACRHEVHLLPEPLAIKRGGHPDQLSRMPALDRFRIASLARLIRQGCLTPAQNQAALAMLRQKCAIYAQGCRRRGRLDEAADYAALPATLMPSALSPPISGRCA